MKIRMFSLGVTVALASTVGLVAPVNVAHASKEGRKNTAIGLGAAAAHQLLNGKTTNGVLLGAGAAYAYKRYKDSEKDENRSRRAASYRANSSRNRSRSRLGGSNLSPSAAPAGSFYFTGTILNDASELTNRKITVDHGGVSRRVSVPKSATVVYAGESLSMHELQKGDRVRVLATRDSDTWKASRIEVLNAAGVQEDLQNRDRFGDPYTRRGGADRTDRTDRVTRTRTSSYNGVGTVERVSSDGRSFDVRVGTNLRTVYVNDSTFQGIGSLDDLREGDRVRVIGKMDGSDVNATQVEFLK